MTVLVAKRTSTSHMIGPKHRNRPQGQNEYQHWLMLQWRQCFGVNVNSLSPLHLSTFAIIGTHKPPTEQPNDSHGRLVHEYVGWSMERPCEQIRTVSSGLIGWLFHDTSREKTGNFSIRLGHEKKLLHSHYHHNCYVLWCCCLFEKQELTLVVHPLWLLLKSLRHQFCRCKARWISIKCSGRVNNDECFFQFETRGKSGRHKRLTEDRILYVCNIYCIEI